jgi:ATP-dependent Clp protease ATP-binding subunit ClpC
MTFKDVYAESEAFMPAVWLDSVFPYRARHFVRIFFVIVTALLFIPVAFFFYVDQGGDLTFLVNSAGDFVANLLTFRQEISGTFLVMGAVVLLLIALEGFYFSILFSDADTSSKEFPPLPRSKGVTPDVAYLVCTTQRDDVTGSFCKAISGRLFFMRLGISPETLSVFCGSVNRVPVGSEALSFPDNERIGFADYVRALVGADTPLRTFLREQGVSPDDIAGSALWIEAMATRAQKHRRWWSRDYLGRTPSLGTSFSYGRAFSLEKYGAYVDETNAYRASSSTLKYFEHDAEDLERVLVREQGAHAIVVAEDADSALAVVHALTRLIMRGAVLSSLEHRRPFLLDSARLTSATGSKALFEATFQKMLADADRAGNIILVISDFPGFIKSAGMLGADISAMLLPYIRSASIHIVGLSDAESYHKTIEPNTSLAEHFETVLLAEKDSSSSVRALLRIAEQLEKHSSVYFSYPAVAFAYESALRAFSGNVPLDKASDLLFEASAEAPHGAIIRASDIAKLVELKTGIPGALPTDNERTKLLALEKLLRTRVIGQDEAVSAVAGALRRARSGIADTKRPLGSFLFLGPTGVGKTETVKALAEVFFGDERALTRFDMSEYSGADGLRKLIGSFETDEPGILATHLREKQYGVLLLDEFEKSSVAVRDLFLQILDEGMFSDAHGKHVSVRSSFVVATSNAGSEEIFRLAEAGKDIMPQKDVIIDGIVTKGIFRPELLNRFDGVILFRPVGGDMTEGIARKLLSGFAQRLSARGYELIITEPLVRFIARAGTDPKFGARPLNRAIEDSVEQMVADKIISGDLKQGAKIEFFDTDFPEAK